VLVLIASLGRSPGVITGTVDALIEEGKKPGRVYIATTSDELIWGECIPLLEREFWARYPDIELDTRQIRISKDDIYDEQDNAEFMRRVAAVVGRERFWGNDVYLSLAGGRKTMSAVMALIGQLYGAKAILHLLVDPELEKDGVITRLLKLPEDRRELVLHPPADKRRLIEFPVFAIPWKINHVVEALKQGGSPDPHLNEIVKDMTPQTRRWLQKVLEEAEKVIKRHSEH